MHIAPEHSPILSARMLAAPLTHLDPLMSAFRFDFRSPLFAECLCVHCLRLSTDALVLLTCNWTVRETSLPPL